MSPVVPEPIAERPETKNYSKDVTAEYAANLSFDEALVMAKSGFLVQRAAWNRSCYVSWATLGKFVAADTSTGTLVPFPVFHSVTGDFMPWLPRDHDITARDYSAYNRQTFEARIAAPLHVRVQDQD